MWLKLVMQLISHVSMQHNIVGTLAPAYIVMQLISNVSMRHNTDGTLAPAYI